MNIIEFFKNDKIQQFLIYFLIGLLILVSIYIFFSFYIEIFITLIFITLVLIYRKIKN